MKEKPYFWSEDWNDNSFHENFYNLLISRPENSAVFTNVVKFLRQNHNKTRKKIVEIGCGSGLLTLYMSKKLYLQPFLLDISPTSLKLVKESSEKLNIKSIVSYGNILKIPLPNDFADIVWSGGVNEHFAGKERIKTFQEMIRICKSNGLIIISVPHSNAPFYRFGVFVRKILGKWSLFEIPYSKEEIIKILDSLSKNISYEFFYEGFLSSILWMLPAGRLKRLSSYLNSIKLPFFDKFGGSIIVVIKKGEEY